jgi:surface protein
MEIGSDTPITVGEYSNDYGSDYFKPIPPLTIPVPSNFTVTASAPDELSLSWDDNNSGLALFEIERSLDGITYTPIFITVAGATSYTNTGLDDNTLYYYRIKAVVSGISSAWITGSATTLNPFRITVKTDNAGVSASNEFRIPWVAGGTYQYDVWYNGAIIHTANGATNTDNTIVFSDGAGTKNIAITGTLRKWSFANSGDRLKLLTISNWGTSEVFHESINSHFDGCANMDITATDIPDLSTCTTLASSFEGCTSLVFNSSINSWDTSNITNLLYTFLNAVLFNQPVNNWNTANVQIMTGTFAANGSNFMSFNQPLNNWDTSNVTTMQFMFQRANQFNQDISAWDVRKVTNMANMFTTATAFNQPIGAWLTEKVTTFSAFLSGATAFNQSLAGFDVISRTGRTTINMQNMLNSCGMNTANYDSTLVGWEVQAPVTGVTLGATGRTYTSAGAGGTARASLISTYGWTITGDSGV